MAVSVTPTQRRLISEQKKRIIQMALDWGIWLWSSQIVNLVNDRFDRLIQELLEIPSDSKQRERVVYRLRQFSDELASELGIVRWVREGKSIWFGLASEKWGLTILYKILEFDENETARWLMEDFKSKHLKPATP